ncbi:MAG TPA: amidohydrolase [Xanthobacteraceae bacterium]|nr:amidohydrolase [Xanthobacteraceae bacterium]
MHLTGKLAICSLMGTLISLAPVATRAASDEQKDFAFSVIERNAAPMAKIGDSIYYFAELGMQEFESTKLLKDVLESAGFTVQLGAAGMPTNLWARWGNGHPAIAIVSEIDALPEGSQTPMELTRKPLVPGAPGHMEGHNTHGGVAAAAAFAVKEAMMRYNIPGSVIVSLGPAEEQLISRPYIVRAGYFKDVDAIIYLHIGDQMATGYGLANYASISATFTFHGKTAHAAVDPWDAKDALDANQLMDVGVAYLRQQLHPTYRIHRVVTNGGIQPNVIPDLAQTWWWVRDADMPDAVQTFEKLTNVAKGAALMTGTSTEYQIIAAGWPQLGMKAIAEAVQSNIDKVGMPRWSDDEQRFAREFQKSAGRPELGLKTTVTPLGGRQQGYASNDNGDVSWTVPAGLLAFPSIVPGITIHEWHAAITPTSSIAHKGMIAGAKVLAASILDLMTRPDVLQRARLEFDQQIKQTPYFAVLPADAKPPLDLNKATMDQYRPLMRKFYLNEQPRLY